MSDHRCVGYNIDATFLLNDRFCLTGSEDRRAYIYDAQDGELVATLGGHKSGVVHVAHASASTCEPLIVTSSLEDVASRRFSAYLLPKRAADTQGCVLLFSCSAVGHPVASGPVRRRVGSAHQARRGVTDGDHAPTSRCVRPTCTGVSSLPMESHLCCCQARSTLS